MRYGTDFVLPAPEVLIWCKFTCFKVNRIVYLNSSLADADLFENEYLSSFRLSVCMHSLIYEAKYQSVTPTLSNDLR
jgi:hypothetical protein